MRSDVRDTTAASEDRISIGTDELREAHYRIGRVTCVYPNWESVLCGSIGDSYPDKQQRRKDMSALHL